jgi:holo-[acyl-carrier-protein] synthase
MIYGIGIDIVDVLEMKQVISSNSNFIFKVFTFNEIKYCDGMNNKFECLSVRFAAKEAVMKAFGIGWNKGIQWKNIEVVKNDIGAPFILLHEKAKVFAKKNKISNIHLSLSHTRSYSSAFVIIETIA